MAQSGATGQSTAFERLGTALLIIGALYLGQDVFVPIALAILLSFILAPLADFLERWRLPRIPSIMIIVSLAFVLLGGLALMVTNQTIELAGSLPKYRENIKDRLELIQSGTSGVISEATEMISGIQEEVAQEVKEQAQEAPITSRAGRGAPAPEAEAEEPIRVEIAAEPPSRLDLIQEIAAPILTPVATAGLVLVFVIFFLIQREDLRDRAIRLLGHRRLDVTTRALDEVGKRISRYLFTQLTINVTYGVPIGIGLWLIGLPGAVLWGLLAIVLRFVPYIGPWLAAAIPILLSLAVFDGWLWPLAVVGLFVALELFSNNVIEPWLYGASTGLSPVGVLLAVVFWSALWGIIGLVIAIPLTVCLVVAGRYLPQLEFLVILLGRDAALSPARRLYQRLLANDQDEVMELALAYVEEHGVIRAYDEMVVPALHMAERDRHADRLEPEREQAILQGVRDIVAEFAERGPTTANASASAESHTPAVLCLPARDEADELAAEMLAQILDLRGVTAEVLSVTSLTGEMADEARVSSTQVVCISSLPPAATSHTRYLSKQLKRQLPAIAIVVGLWDVTGDPARMIERLREGGADYVVTTYEAAVDQIQRLIR